MATTGPASSRSISGLSIFATWNSLATREGAQVHSALQTECCEEWRKAFWLRLRRVQQEVEPAESANLLVRAWLEEEEAAAAGELGPTRKRLQVRENLLYLPIHHVCRSSLLL